jgi:acetolactate decarboxylase
VILEQQPGMANLSVTIPSSLEAEARDLSAKKRSSVDGLVADALSEYVHSYGRNIFQISTATALVEGVYSGSISSSILLQRGNFGLGTFENLDGEMIILDGEIYQAAGDVRHRSDDFSVPFASVTHFQEGAAFEIGSSASLKEIEVACDRYRESENLFCALRLDGVFDFAHVRAVHPVPEDTRLLDAAGTELEFLFPEVEGTLVGLWSPGYSSAFSVPGYHFHFISKDRSKGGHVLNCAAQLLHAKMQIVREYHVRLPAAGSFLTADLSRDPASDLAKAE